ncbi:MAG: MerR family DNA-binding transcriptional regulator [Planctomycetota bacterium]
MGKSDFPLDNLCQPLIMFDMVTKTTKKSRMEAPNGLSRYLTVKQAAKLLGVSASTLRNWDRQGKLCPARHPINGYRLYLETDLQQLLSNLAT